MCCSDSEFAIGGMELHNTGKNTDMGWSVNVFGGTFRHVETHICSSQCHVDDFRDGKIAIDECQRSGENEKNECDSISYFIKWTDDVLNECIRHAHNIFACIEYLIKLNFMDKKKRRWDEEYNERDCDEWRKKSVNFDDVSLALAFAFGCRWRVSSFSRSQLFAYLLLSSTFSSITSIQFSLVSRFSNTFSCFYVCHDRCLHFYVCLFDRFHSNEPIKVEKEARDEENKPKKLERKFSPWLCLDTIFKWTICEVFFRLWKVLTKCEDSLVLSVPNSVHWNGQTSILHVRGHCTTDSNRSNIKCNNR